MQLEGTACHLPHTCCSGRGGWPELRWWAKLAIAVMGVGERLKCTVQCAVGQREISEIMECCLELW